MVGPHAIWADEPVSPAKRLRVTRQRTQQEAADAAGCSLTAYHNLESRGIGSDGLWERVAASFGVAVASIKPPISPACEPTAQYVLPGTSSS